MGIGMASLPMKLFQPSQRSQPDDGARWSRHRRRHHRCRFARLPVRRVHRHIVATQPSP